MAVNVTISLETLNKDTYTKYKYLSSNIQPEKLWSTQEYYFPFPFAKFCRQKNICCQKCREKKAQLTPKLL